MAVASVIIEAEWMCVDCRGRAKIVEVLTVSPCASNRYCGRCGAMDETGDLSLVKHEVIRWL